MTFGLIIKLFSLPKVTLFIVISFFTITLNWSFMNEIILKNNDIISIYTSDKRDITLKWLQTNFRN